jgi:eukaryotic-like serine/threonine-protein kinase
MPPVAAVAPAALVRALKKAWRDGAAPDAAGALRDYPSLLRHRSLVVDLAYEEYCLREEAGRVPDTESFCRVLPAFRSEVRSVIRGHRALFDRPEVYDRFKIDWPEPGQAFAGFTVVRELGRGAFARAYLAVDPDTGNRPVVLKLSPDPSAEAKTLGPVSHPHVANVLWARRADDVSAICLRYVGAATLADAIAAAVGPTAAGRPTARTVLDAISTVGDGLPRPDPLPPVLLRPSQSYSDAVAAIAARLAAALAYLHSRGVTHGDLKPSNVVLGPGGHPYLIDFNLAGGADDALRRCGGTLPYMAPERIRLVLGEQPEVPIPLDGADVYSLGAVLFEALTGRVPFEPAGLPDETAEATELLGRVVTGPPPPAESGVPRRLARLVRRCLDPDVGRRPSAALLARELDRFVRRRVRRGLLAAAIGVLLVAGSIAVWLATRSPAEHASSSTAKDSTDTAALAERRTPDTPTVPRTPHDFIRRGFQRLDTEDDYMGARDDFRRAYQLQPAGRPAALMAYCLTRAANYLDATGLYREAVSRGYEESWVYSNLAFAIIQDNLNAPPMVRAAALPAAVEAADAALSRDRACRSARYNRARARFDLTLDRNSWTVPDPLVVPALDRDLKDLLDDPPEGHLPYVLAAQILVGPANADEARMAEAVRMVAKAVSLGLRVGPATANPVFRRLIDREDFRRIRDPQPPITLTVKGHPGLIRPSDR